MRNFSRRNIQNNQGKTVLCTGPEGFPGRNPASKKYFNKLLYAVISGLPHS